MRFEVFVVGKYYEVFLRIWPYLEGVDFSVRNCDLFPKSGPTYSIEFKFWCGQKLLSAGIGFNL